MALAWKRGRTSYRRDPMSLKWIRLLSFGAALAVAAPASEALARDRHHGNQGLRRHGVDRNRDGVITRGEWRGNSQSFRVQDRNGDGVISASDRFVATRRSGLHGWDFNRDGVV